MVKEHNGIQARLAPSTTVPYPSTPPHASLNTILSTRLAIARAVRFHPQGFSRKWGPVRKAGWLAGALPLPLLFFFPSNLHTFLQPRPRPRPRSPLANATHASLAAYAPHRILLPPESHRPNEAPP